MTLTRLPSHWINALDKCTCCVFDAKKRISSHNVRRRVNKAFSFSLIQITISSKQLKRRKLRGEYRRKGERRRRRRNRVTSQRSEGQSWSSTAIIKIITQVNTTLDEGGKKGERWDSIPLPTSCLIRSFVNYRRKHRVNCYTRTVLLAWRLFDRSRFFNPLLVSFSPFVLSLFLSLTHKCSSDNLSPNRDPWKYNVGPRILTFRSQDSHRAKEEHSLGGRLDGFWIIHQLARSCKQFFVLLDNRKTLILY